jgi:hypothetical protein
MSASRDYRRLIALMIAVMSGLGMLIVVPVAEAGCASEDRIALAQMGYSTAQIDAMCGSGGNPFVTPSLPAATICATPAGSCYLGDRIPVGSQCWCPTRLGHIVHGIAR